mmetsp:Transcript_16652/g.35242  ORF Transcript_16652/g.35242 Transcript_16652/m.35242 type:complete len:378 (+) Transcript_16652:127-1260(+)
MAGGRTSRRCGPTRLGVASDRALAHWAPKWRRLLPAQGVAPTDYTEFDRTVRGMLNRISVENACRILPLEPSLRGAELASGDCPAWWAARFAALMLSSYLQVIHTNRHARGVVAQQFGAADNMLPGFISAAGPLFVRSPRLFTALLAWLAELLRWRELCWPTARLLLLAASEDQVREALPLHSLAHLPAELIRGRILGFLVPPRAPAVESLLDGGALAAFVGPLVGSGAGFGSGSRGEDDERDVVALLAHLVMFAPRATWPRVSAFAFCLGEGVLASPRAGEGERGLYLAASVLAALAQRVEAGLGDGAGALSRDDLCRHRIEDLEPLCRLTALLREVAEARRRSAGLSKFVDYRVHAALERLQDAFRLAEQTIWKV